MDHLTDTTVSDLQRALEAVEGKRPTLRLVAAIAHENGVTQSELAEWFDVERKTIYNWLRRFEERDPATAARDDHRPGRPHKLPEGDRDRLEDHLREPPTAAGVDAPAWTTELLQAFVRDRFDVEYSLSSCRRLLREAGLRPVEPGQAPDAMAPGTQNDSGEGESRPGHVWVPG